jgi:hypothetical protein
MNYEKSKLLKVGVLVLVIPTLELGEISRTINNLFLVDSVLYTEKDLEIYTKSYRQDYILRYKEEPTKALDRWSKFLDEVKPLKANGKPTTDKYLGSHAMAHLSSKKISTPHRQDLKREG